jgi:hypothetical protein
MEKKVLDARRIFFERGVKVKSMGVSAEFEGALEDCRAGAGSEATVEERPSPIDDDFGGIEVVF